MSRPGIDLIEVAIDYSEDARIFADEIPVLISALALPDPDTTATAMEIDDAR